MLFGLSQLRAATPPMVWSDRGTTLDLSNWSKRACGIPSKTLGVWPGIRSCPGAMTAIATSTVSPVLVVPTEAVPADKFATRSKSPRPRVSHGDPVTTTKPGQGISNLPGSVDRSSDPDERATRLMDEFRQTRCSEIFDELIALTRDQLLSRVRSRVRFLGKQVDPEELLQDTIINIYRYPDRFDASRPGAFRAWSSTIVDNAARRYLRNKRTGVDISFLPTEMLAQEKDQGVADPASRTIQKETSRQLAQTFSLFLVLYLKAYDGLSEREQFVLHMVEVKEMRYAQLAEIMEIRAEALKMVVFRARQRIQKKIAEIVAAN